MSRFNTGNPLGSDALQDLSDNAKNADLFSNDLENDKYKDRFGRERKTIHGMQKEFDIDQAERNLGYEAQVEQFDRDQADRKDRFDQLMVNSGYHFIGDYAPGVVLSEYNQIVRDIDGEFWRASGKTELPYTLTGNGVDEGGALVSVGDSHLRGDLLSQDKGAMIVANSVVSLDNFDELEKDNELFRNTSLLFNIKGSLLKWSEVSEKFERLSLLTFEAFGATGYDSFEEAEVGTDSTNEINTAILTANSLGVTVKGAGKFYRIDGRVDSQGLSGEYKTSKIDGEWCTFVCTSLSAGLDIVGGSKYQDVRRIRVDWAKNLRVTDFTGEFLESSMKIINTTGAVGVRILNSRVRLDLEAHYSPGINFLFDSSRPNSNTSEYKLYQSNSGACGYYFTGGGDDFSVSTAELRGRTAYGPHLWMEESVLCRQWKIWAYLENGVGGSKAIEQGVPAQVYFGGLHYSSLDIYSECYSGKEEIRIGGRSKNNSIRSLRAGVDVDLTERGAKNLWLNASGESYQVANRIGKVPFISYASNSRMARAGEEHGLEFTGSHGAYFGRIIAGGSTSDLALGDKESPLVGICGSMPFAADVNFPNKSSIESLDTRRAGNASIISIKRSTVQRGSVGVFPVAKSNSSSGLQVLKATIGLISGASILHGSIYWVKSPGGAWTEESDISNVVGSLAEIRVLDRDGLTCVEVDRSSGGGGISARFSLLGELISLEP